MAKIYYNNNGIWSSIQPSDIEAAAGNTGIWYGICNTDDTTAYKEININNFELKIGTIIIITFNYESGEVPNLYLNVNSTNNIRVWNNGNIVSNTHPLRWVAHSTMSFMYDGTYWCYLGNGNDLIVDSKIAIPNSAGQGDPNIVYRTCKMVSDSNPYIYTNNTGWTYEIYSSGKIHASAILKWRAAITQTYHGIYWSDPIYCPLPVKMQDLRSIIFGTCLSGSNFIPITCVSSLPNGSTNVNTQEHWDGSDPNGIKFLYFKGAAWASSDNATGNWYYYTPVEIWGTVAAN